MENKLTIFTPTYNRAHVLPALYQSLKDQTNKNFCWLVVDDGSTDNTKQLIEGWKKENCVSINYYYQENQGKSQAFNKGANETKTDFFVCIDSDDVVTKDMVEEFYQNIKFINTNSYGLVAYRSYDKSGKMEYGFPNVAYTSLENIYSKGYRGETTLILKTQMIKNKPFPKFENEKFVTEDWLYCQLDAKYNLYVLPKVLSIGDYQSDGLTKNELNLYKKSLNGFEAYYNLKLKQTKSIKTKLKSAILYVCTAKFLKRKKIIKNSNNKFLVFVCYLFGLMWYHRKKKIIGE